MSEQQRIKINAGAWLLWAYENLSEVQYLRFLRAARVDQQATARRARLRRARIAVRDDD